MSPPIAFIIGAGPRVGISAARLLASQGYKVAVGSRKPDVEATKKEGLFPVTINISKHETISEAFDEVERGLGGPANVVIFNAATHVSAPTDNDPLSLSFEDFAAVAAGGVAVFGAAQRAVTGFRKIMQGPRVFIYTGNLLPWLPPMKPWFSSNIQKRIGAAIIEQAAASYGKEGFRFYYGHEVSPTGGVAIPPNGDAHAQAFWRLIQAPEQLPWDQRFVADGSQFGV